MHVGVRSGLVALSAVLVAAIALALWLVGSSVSRPVVSCATAPRNPLSAPPAALVTAHDDLAQGDYDYDRGACNQAVADYSKAIELDPGSAEAYNNRAYVYMVLKDYASALPDLDRAIEIRPNYVNALMNRGDIHNYYYDIDYARAVADYDRVLAADPQAAGTTSVCGHRLLALNRGWSPRVVAGLIANGANAGCPSSAH